jgi:HSP20 family protein
MGMSPFRGRGVFYDPQSEMNRMFDDMFGSLMRRPGSQQRAQQFTEWAPAIDVLAKDGDLVIRAELPGVKQEDVDITLHNNVLTISGERKVEQEEERGGYHVRERRYGSFRRSLALPEGLDESEIHARYENGVLEVTVQGAAATVQELERDAELDTEPDAASEELVAELEKRNMLRVFDDWRHFEKRCLSGPILQEKLGISRQRLKQLRDENKLIGLRIPMRREFYYPLWQFAEDGHPLPVIPRLMGAAEEAHIDALTLDALMTSKSAGNGTPPAELLRAGREDHVVEIIRAALSEGS